MRRTSIPIALALLLACAGCGDDSSTANTSGAGGAGQGGQAGQGGDGEATTSSTSVSSAGGAGGAEDGSTTSHTSTGTASTSTGGTEDIPDFNGCTTPDYVDGSAEGFDRTVLVGDAGLSFTPKCLRIAAGQSVAFDGSFTAHPIAPGNPEDHQAGSPDSPITATTSGSSVTFTFPSAGTFPYYCMLHGFGDGMGMAGVIHVD